MTPPADPELPHALERELLLRTRRETVFRFFDRPERWEAWWGAGSRVEPWPGGELHVRYPNGVEASGKVLAVEPPARFAFSFGYASGEPIAPGASRVTIELADEPAGARLRLRHELADAAARDLHVQGWRYQLALLANLVADATNAGVEATVDAWVALWSEPDAERRAAILGAIAAPEVRFRDRWSAVEGAAEVAEQLAAVHRFQPGARLERAGAVRHCQGTAVADWRASRGDAELGRGTNVFGLDADGRIEDVVGIWGA